MIDQAKIGKRQKIFHWTAFVGVTGAVVGLVFSPGMQSIGTMMFIIIAVAIWPFLAAKASNPKDNTLGKELKAGFLRYWKDPVAVLFGILYLMHILGGLITRDGGAWANDLRIKLPLLLVPLAVHFFPGFSRLQYRWLAFFAALSVWMIAVGTSVNYFLNQETIDQMIAQSQPMPIFLGISHIYYSFVLAFGIILGAWLFIELKDHPKKWLRWGVFLLSLFNFIALHLFTARTGLVAFYAAIALFILVYFFRKKRYLLAGILLLGLAAGPVLGYLTLSSLRNRIDNTIMDVQTWMEGGDPNYLSLSMRLEANKTGWHLFTDSPLVGAGIGDMETEMDNQYIRDGSCLISTNWVMPHNQYLFFLAGLGLAGGLVFLLACIMPFFQARYRNSNLFLLLWTLMIFSMLAESLLERQVGVTFFTLFWFLTPQIDASE